MCVQGRPHSSIAETTRPGSDCRWDTSSGGGGGGGDCTSGVPGAHARRTAPWPAAAICGASGEVAAVSGEAAVLARRRGEGSSARWRGVLCGAPRPPPPRREDAQTGRGERGTRGGRPGVPTSPPGHRAGRGRGACRRSLFVRRGAGRGGGQAALSSPGGDVRSRVGRGGGVGHRLCACPLPERPALTLRSYCGRFAASLGRSASDKARGAPRPQRRQRTKPGSRSVARG